RDLRTVHRVRVVSLGVIRDEVARLHAELFHVDGVTGADFIKGLRPFAEQRDCLLRSAIDGVHEIELAHAVVVLRLRLDEHFFERVRRRIALGLFERHRRRAILDHVDRVLRRCRHILTTRTVELHVVIAVLLYLEAAAERAVRLHRERRGDRRIELQSRTLVRFNLKPPTAGRRRRRNLEPNLGAGNRRDITADFDLLRSETGVRRVDVLHFYRRDGRQLDDRHRVVRRFHAGGFHVVGHRRLDVEQHAFEFVLLGRRHERQPRELLLVLRLHPDANVIRPEPGQLRHDRLVRSLRDFLVTGRHIDGVGARGFRALREHQKRGRALPQELGTDDEEEGAGGGDRAQRHGAALHAHAADGLAAVNLLGLLDGLRDELVHDDRRHVRRRSEVHGGQNRGLQLRLVLFNVEGNLKVRHALAHRAHHPRRNEQREHRKYADPEAGHRLRAELVGLEAPGRNRDGRERAEDDDDAPAQEHAHPPALPYLADDGYEFLTDDAVRFPSHWCLLERRVLRPSLHHIIEFTRKKLPQTV